MGIVPGKIFEKEDWKKKLSINFITVLFFFVSHAYVIRDHFYILLYLAEQVHSGYFVDLQ